MSRFIPGLCRALGAVAAGLVLAVAPVRAQSGGQITMLVPYPAGGSADAFGRMMAEELGKALDARVNVDNRPGGSSLVAMSATARAPADGRTIMLATNSGLINNIAMIDKMPINAEKDLAPVAMVGAQSMLMVVRKDAPFRTVDEMLGYARAHPGKITRGTPGVSTIANIGFSRFEMLEHFSTTHVPYKGDAPALTDLLGGTVDVYVGGGNQLRQVIASGKLQGLAVMGPQRFADLPDVKTMKELGHPDGEARSWFAVVVPAATPMAVQERLAAALNRVTSDPANVQRMQALGIDAYTLPRARTVQVIDEERAKWVPLIRQLGIKPE
jgi:tripartite-type tricarboxylate transporter receptor subunit TctC